MAAYTLKRMTAPTQLGTSASTVYTVGTGVTAVVKQILVVNVSASATTVTIHAVPSAGSAGTTNRIFSALPIAPNATLTLDLSQVLTAGDTIQALAGATSAVNVMISGYEAS